MDDRERQRLKAAFAFHAELQWDAVNRALDAVTSQFALNNRLDSGAYYREALDCIGAAILAFAQEMLAEVLKGGRSHDSYMYWEEHVRSFEIVSYDGWEEQLSPYKGEAGPITDTVHELVKHVTAGWSDKLSAFLEKSRFDFEDAPPKPKQQTGLDGWPIPGSETFDPALTAVLPPDIKPLSEAALRKWWTSLGSARDQMSLVALLHRARADHPDCFISRDRIRALAPGRKRGPRQFGGKATAE